VEGVDVYVTNKAVDGKTLAELAGLPGRAACSAENHAWGDRHFDPILPNTQLDRAICHPRGADPRHNAAAKLLGAADRPTDVADVRSSAPVLRWAH